MQRRQGLAGWMAAYCFVASMVAANPDATAAALVAVNPQLTASGTQSPKKVVLLPPQFYVYELSAGGVPTRKIDWEAQARTNFANAAQALATEKSLFELTTAPELDAATTATLDAHMGLYERVASSVFVYGRGESAAWAHKKNEFDYTVGAGLDFLREATGADAAMIVLGADYISSDGRRAAFFAGLAIGLLMPLGQSFITAGVIDLKTGDVLWMGLDSSIRLDSRVAADARQLLGEVVATWPAQALMEKRLLANSPSVPPLPSSPLLSSPLPAEPAP